MTVAPCLVSSVYSLRTDKVPYASLVVFSMPTSLFTWSYSPEYRKPDGLKLGIPLYMAYTPLSN